jgi:hypothetical protein
MCIALLGVRLLLLALTRPLTALATTRYTNALLASLHALAPARTLLQNFTFRRFLDRALGGDVSRTAPRPTSASFRRQGR